MCSPESPFSPIYKYIIYQYLSSWHAICNKGNEPIAGDLPMSRIFAAAALVMFAVSMPCQAYDRDFFYPKLAEAKVTSPQSPAEAQRQDAEFFRQYFDLELAYPPGALPEARKRLDALAAQAGQLSPAAFHMEIRRIVALANNGHSRSNGGILPDGKTYPRFPFLALPFSDGYCVTRAMAPATDLLGACIIAIDGTPLENIMARFRDAVGGNDAHYRIEFTALLALPEFLYAEHITKRPDQAEITFKFRDGRTGTRVLKSLPGETFTPTWTALPIMPKPMSVNDPWESFMHADSTLPLYLSHPEQLFVGEPMPDGKGYYLQLKLNLSQNGESIEDFLKKTLTEIGARKPAYLVADLRFNGGGDLTSTTKTLASVPGLLSPDGRVYILTNAWTFSAAITSANVLKQTAGARARVVGESAGDGQRFWAEGGRLCMPNSKICANYTRGLHDYAKGCSGEFGCYYDALRIDVPSYGLIPLAQPSLAPDIRVPMSFADYAAGKDPVMDAVAAEERRLNAAR